MKIKRMLALGNKGFLMPAVLSFIIVILIISGAVLQIINTNLWNVNNNVKSQRAFNVAEAGINYYLWHLSHSSTDNYDGTGACKNDIPALGCGGYKHDYVDSNAVKVGFYTLYIKPKGGGSTIVTVRSIGQLYGDNNIRTVEAQIGATSFASYGLVSDTAFWFGQYENASGPVHSNLGIRMDGANSDVVSSSNITYTPPPGYGGGTNKPGVWCDPSITTPVNCNTRNKTDWLFPKPTVNFAQVSGSLCTMKKVAFANDAATAALANLANACTQTPNARTAAYVPKRASFSTFGGYMIQLNNNGTYNLSRVDNENDTIAGPYTSAMTLTSVATNIAIPSSGVIFVEDNVWVRSNPTFHGRVNIGAGQLNSANNAQIIIADNLRYSVKDGTDVIGLVAEDSVLVAPYAPPWPGSAGFNFEIDAAALASTGKVTYPSRYRRNNACTRGWVNSNQTFTFYGSAATRQAWTWNIFGGSCGDRVFDATLGYYISGVEHTDTQYDYNLLYAPPPSYPLTS